MVTDTFADDSANQPGQAPAGDAVPLPVMSDLANLEADLNDIDKTLAELQD